MAGPLKNARHEKFAQELAKGNTKLDAYVSAGFKPDRGAATRLSANVNVSARIDELKGKAAERCVITADEIAQRLLRIAEKGEAGKDAPMLSVGRASLMDVAKLRGHIIDRSKVGFDFGSLSDEDLDALDRILGKTSPDA
jgi:hypothetical protein